MNWLLDLASRFDHLSEHEQRRTLATLAKIDPRKLPKPEVEFLRTPPDPPSLTDAIQAAYRAEHPPSRPAPPMRVPAAAAAPPRRRYDDPPAPPDLVAACRQTVHDRRK